MNYKKIIISIFYCSLISQSFILTMMRQTSKALTSAYHLPSSTTENTVYVPMSKINSENMYQAIKGSQPEESHPSWTDQNIVPLHPDLPKPFFKTTNVSEQAQPKRKFWDSFNKKNIGKSIGVAGALDYAYQQQEQIAQAQEITEKNNAELKQNLIALEETINRFDTDPTTWTDYHNNIMQRFQSVYKYVLTILSTEELIQEYVQTKNAIMAIEESNFKKHLLTKLSHGKNWFESQAAYETRIANDLAEYDQAFAEHMKKQNNHMRNIHDAPLTDPLKLQNELAQIKPIVIVQKNNIKNLSNFQPRALPKYWDKWKFTLPPAPESLLEDL